MVSRTPLSQLSRGELEFLRQAITRRQIPTPISEMALQSVGKGKLYARLGPLAGAGHEAALALLEMALSGAETAPSASPAAPAPALVWTGPDVPMSKARPTTAKVLELLGSARQRVLVAGYEFDHGAVIFQPLHRAMQERGVQAAIYLDIRPAPSPRTNMGSYLALQAHGFLKRNWPFGEPVPELYYFPAGVEHGSHKSLHAKCVVVDGTQVLVGSANFTRRGHARNIEVGVQLEDAELAAALASQFARLVEQGALARLPVAAVRERPPSQVEDEGEDGEASPISSGAHGPGPGLDQLAEELYVSAEARPLFVRLLEAGLVAPRVGEDIEGEDGEVLASPELSWLEQRVAALLPEQEASRKRLEEAGWTCVSIPPGAGELDALCELVGRAG